MGRGCATPSAHVGCDSGIEKSVSLRVLALSTCDEFVALTPSAAAGLFGISCSSQVKEYDKIRLVLLFALRYEREGASQVDQLLNTFPSSEAQARLDSQNYRLSHLRPHHCSLNARKAHVALPILLPTPLRLAVSAPEDGEDDAGLGRRVEALRRRLWCARRPASHSRGRTAQAPRCRETWLASRQAACHWGLSALLTSALSPLCSPFRRGEEPAVAGAKDGGWAQGGGQRVHAAPAAAAHDPRQHPQGVRVRPVAVGRACTCPQRRQP